LAAAAVLVIALGCSGESEKPVSSSEGEQPLQTFEQLLLRETEGGRLRWVLRADSAQHFGERDETLLTGVHVDFYNATGDTLRSWLTAEEGQVDRETRNLVAQGSVLIETREGQTLETEQLRWDNERGKVVSNHYVRLTDGDTVIEGVGIESDPGLKAYTIHSHVNGEFHDGGEGLDELEP